MSTLLEKGGNASAGLLRVALGIMYLTHSIVLKLLTFGLAGTAGYFASIGLPAGLAYAVFAAELAGGLLLVANVATPWVAIALLPILGGALWVHSGNGWVFSAPGGGWEYPLFLIVVSLVVAFQALAARSAARAPQPARVGSIGHLA